MRNRFYGSARDEGIIEQFKERCRKLGLDPGDPPVFTHGYTEEQLAAVQLKYKDSIEVIHYFVDRFLSSVSGSPVLVAISDDKGYLLGFGGDPSMADTVRTLGIKEGVQYNDAAGPNSIQLCIETGQPFYLLGQDHYYEMLHHLACYTSPFYHEGREGIAGTISLMTDLEHAHPHLQTLLNTVADSVERELMLRRQNKHLQILNKLLMGTSCYGLAVTNSSGKLIQINENFVPMMRMEPEEDRLIGSSVFDLTNIGPVYQQVIHSGEACMGHELSIESDEGCRYYMLDAVPVYNDQSVLSWVVGVVRDITELKNTEEVLRNTEKLVFAGQLAVSIAHEVRNPLTTVKGLLQLSDQSGKLQHYELMMSELERMNLIVGEFLILGKPQAVQFKEESCAQILEEVLSVFGIQAGLNHINIQTDILSSPAVRCDRNQIKQVFLNILRNASEALPFGGSIHIRLDVLNGFQRVRFTDNGVGMTEEVLRRIGEPFHTTKPEGNGLGMMIVRKIMDTHKGKMSVESQEGQGTSVDIFLPLNTEA